MKNEVLKFVYNMLPESEKEVLEALEQTEDDEKEALEQAQENADKPENAEKSENPEGTVEENKPSETENETEAAVATETNEIAQDLAEATGRSISTSETQDSKPKSDSSDDIPNKADEINVF